jgi:hypothetical protein
MREGSAVGGGGARAQGGKRGRQQRESVGEQGATRRRGAPVVPTREGGAGKARDARQKWEREGSGRSGVRNAR